MSHTIGNAIGYVRVSTIGQAEDGLGLEVQEEALRRWAKENTVRLGGVWRDEGVSGTVADRPGLGAALAALEDGTADTLLVYRLDRLARDLILQETIIERVALNGRQVLSVTEPDLSGTDPTRVLVRHLLGAISQYERMVINARMAAGRRAKAARGGYAYGAPRLGWRAEGGELEVDPAEQETVARILELRHAGRSLRQIVVVLQAEGRGTKRGGRWDPSTVGRIVRRAMPDAKIIEFPDTASA